MKASSQLGPHYRWHWPRDQTHLDIVNDNSQEVLSKRALVFNHSYFVWGLIRKKIFTSCLGKALQCVFVNHKLFMMWHSSFRFLLSSSFPSLFFVFQHDKKDTLNRDERPKGWNVVIFIFIYFWLKGTWYSNKFRTESSLAIRQCQWFRPFPDDIAATASYTSYS